MHEEREPVAIATTIGDVMGLIATDSGGGGFASIEPGSYLAVCTRVVDLGTQGTDWGPKHQVRISWELPTERMEWEGKDMPRLVSKIYTMSLHEKSNLGQHLTAWRKRPFTEEERNGFDLAKLLGVPCTITIAPNSSGKGTHVSGVGPMMKGTAKPKPEGQAYSWMIEDGMDETYGTFSDWLKETIGQAQEWGMPDAPGNDDQPPPPEDDDIPF